jgi:hypothetical protein
MNVKAISVIFAMCAMPVFSQAGAGAKFGARDPRTCASMKTPARGAPTGDQLKQIFICESENVSSSIASGELLHLVTDVNIEVAKGRPFQMRTDAWPDIDPSQLVYPIRGSYVMWQCVALGRINGERGKNCTKADQPHASGVCYKDTFGDWHCKFMDGNAGNPGMQRYPPPTGK